MELYQAQKLSCIKRHNQPGIVAHICNPSYLEGRDQEDCVSVGDQPRQKTLARHHLN
jgi:hypothetical protein